MFLVFFFFNQNPVISPEVSKVLLFLLFSSIFSQTLSSLLPSLLFNQTQFLSRSKTTLCNAKSNSQFSIFILCDLPATLDTMAPPCFIEHFLHILLLSLPSQFRILLGSSVSSSWFLHLGGLASLLMSTLFVVPIMSHGSICQWHLFSFL